MKIGYILGMKTGIHRFIYRELCHLENKFDIYIYPTKMNPGIYNPKASWHVLDQSKQTTLLKQIWYALAHPIRYPVLFLEALFNGALAEFALAQTYAADMKQQGVDRIHCHFGDSKFFIGYFCKKMLDIPLSVTIHAHELYRNPNRGMFIKSLAVADAIIAISEFNKKQLISEFKVPKKKIKVIRLAVDEETDVLSPKKKILTVGSFEERKGYDVMCKALAKIKRNDYEWWVVGTGHLPVEEWAHGLPVKFLGSLHQDVLNIVMAQCDFFMLASKTAQVEPVKESNITAPGEDREGIPTVLMEAMLAGKPVIATKHAGIPELVDKILVKENNVADLAKAITTMLNRPGSYKKMGRQNKAKVQKYFSPKNIDKLAEVFRHGV